jgi:hypothetical protein
MSRKSLKQHKNIEFYTQYIHPTLICRGTHTRTHTRTIFTQYSGISSCSYGSTYTFSCLNHIFLSYYFLLASVQSLSHRQCLLPHPTHHHRCHLSMADIPTTKQNNTSHGQSMSPPFCPPAAPLLPATSLTSCSLLAARRPTLATLGQSSGFDQCTAHCMNKIK